MRQSRHRSMFGVAALSLALLGGCGDDDLVTSPQLRELDRAEALWATHGQGAYTMEQQRLCFCANTDVYRLTVVNEQVVSGVSVATGAALPVTDLQYYLSVAQLFARIRATLASANPTVIVTYDTGAGYPVSAAFDPIPNAVDDEITYRTANVQTRLE